MAVFDSFRGIREHNETRDKSIFSGASYLKYLYPLLAPPRGCLYSQEGHLPIVIDVFRRESFLQREVGCSRPHAEGIGIRKLLWATKPAQAREHGVT